MIRANVGPVARTQIAAVAMAMVIASGGAACGRSSGFTATKPDVRDDGGATGAAAAPTRVPPLPSVETADEAMGRLAADALGLARQAIVRADALPQLVDVELAHARLTGRLDDYQVADAASARGLALAPADPDAHLVRARVDATLHRFADAAAELERARAAGASPSVIALQQLELDQATGRLADPVAARRAAADKAPNPVSLTMLALALDERGDVAGALAVMPRALATVRDPSAPPLCWLLFQWGRLAEDADDAALAEAMYAEAAARLPRYGEAVRHLAALRERAGDDRTAADLLDRLDAADPHPETTAMRAELAARAGDPRAAALRDAARAGWERYLAAFPAAFADHAARFYLGVGADPARALTLAEANLAGRATAEAHALVVDAALAAGDHARACAAADALVARGPAPKRLRFAAWKAYAACGRPADADRLAHELGIDTAAPR